MFEIALINMPFASPNVPSIALTQLQFVVTKRLDEQVKCEIHYLNHDFVDYFGREIYQRIGDSVRATVSGLGDWMFRQVAFPQVEDNLSAYRQRYGHVLEAECQWLQTHDHRRRELGSFLDQLIDRYRLDQCSLVGFTSMFAQNVSSFAMARKLKERNPNVVTVMGGANCEASMGAVIARNVEALDFVFSGPALTTFPQLVQHLVQGRRDQCHRINGVLTREKLGRDPPSEVNEIGQELGIDEMIPLDYDRFLTSLDEKCPGAAPSLLFETSRGCWWGEKSHCTFCGLNGTTMNYRAMPPALALRQFDDLFRYAPRVARYESVDNILPRKYLVDVLPHVKPPRDASIFYEVKADLKDHELQVLADAGVTEIQPGIEALASSTLKLMKKGTTAFHNIRFLKSCLVYGIRPRWNVLVGFPGEQEEVYKKYLNDLPLLVHLPPPSGVFPVRFDRFSPYFTSAREYGLKLRPNEFYSMVYPFPERDLEDLAYFFADHNYENTYIAHTGKWIGKLEAIVERWNRRWHQGDGKLKPGLTFQWRDDTKIVQDTRSGVTQEHEVEPLGLRLLECLAQPAKLPRLAEKVQGAPESELVNQLNDLRMKGLVFEEGDRYISLLVDSGREEGYV